MCGIQVRVGRDGGVIEGAFCWWREKGLRLLAIINFLERESAVNLSSLRLEGGAWS